MPGMRRPAARVGLYVGGFLGPFGGGVIAVLIPELRHAFGASTGAVTAGIAVYMIPFAALQLVSGTVGARLGPERTVRAAYLAYAAASLAVAAAGSIAPFLCARALQGAANAFSPARAYSVSGICTAAGLAGGVAGGGVARGLAAQ